jgi:hypothetical protein
MNIDSRRMLLYDNGLAIGKRKKSVFSGFLHVGTKNIHKKVIAPGLARGDSIMFELFLCAFYARDPYF